MGVATLVQMTLILAVSQERINRIDSQATSYFNNFGGGGGHEKK